MCMSRRGGPERGRPSRLRSIELVGSGQRCRSVTGWCSNGPPLRAQSSRRERVVVASLNHLGITVTDLDASLAFYRDVIGFELDLRTRVGGEWFDTLTRNQGADIEIAMLRLAGFTLQLVQYHAAGGATLPLAHHNVGNPHLCIQVDDVDARHENIEASRLYDPTPIVDIMGTGIRSFYVHDPDGVPVELLQAPS